MKKIVSLLLAVSMICVSFGMTVQATPTSKMLKTKEIITKQVKSTDGKKKKIKTIFEYVEDNYGYKRAKNFSASKGWEKEYAVEMYKSKRGSCYHFAATYALLVKKATGYEVRIGIGKTTGFAEDRLQDHAWVEVKVGKIWYICDPNMDKFAAKSSGKYFYKERSKLKNVYNNFEGVQYVTVSL